MKGQLVRRGPETWLVRVYLGRDSATKRRRYLNKTIRGPKRDAQAWLTKTLREIDTQFFAEPSKRTLGEFLTQWLDVSVKPRAQERTLHDYQAIARRYLLPSLGQRTLSQLTALEIQNLYADLQTKGLSARTVRYAHAVLRSALQQAVRWNFLARNPATLIDLPRHNRREMHALSIETAGHFLEAAKADRWYPLWLLLLTSGLRPGEALGLKWADVDPEDGKIRVQRALVPNRGRGGWSLREPKTPRSRRTVTLPSTTVAALRAHKRRQTEEILAAGEDYQRFDLVFANPLGGPLALSNLTTRHFQPLLERAAYRILGLDWTPFTRTGFSVSAARAACREYHERYRAAVAQAGLAGFRIYDLRHTCATLLLATGENPKVVSERLGHASITLTLDTYSHVLPDMQARSAERLEGVLFGNA